MQILFQVLNPKSLKLSFIYERTTSQKVTDEIDEAIYLLVERLSKSISSEPFQIDKYSNVNISNFLTAGFHSQKTIYLVFRCFNKKETDSKIEKEKIIPLSLYFDTADKEYIDNIIDENQYISISAESFDLLDTFITHKD